MVPHLFPLLGVDDLICSPLDDKVCEWNYMVDIIYIFPNNNWVYIKAPVGEVGNELDGILLTETP